MLTQPVNLIRGASLKDRNTLAVDAYAEFFISVSHLDLATEVLDWARHSKKTISILGDGSNILLPEHTESVVVHPAFKGVEITASDDEYQYVKVGAGENWHAFTKWALDHGCYGIENLSLSPGSVGAAPIQNIGAYGVEVAPFIDRIDVLDLRYGKCRTLRVDDCAFAYRSSVFKSDHGRHLLITHVYFRLFKNEKVNVSYPALNHFLKVNVKGVQPSAKEVADAVIQIRKSKLPSPDFVPNVGSFFKNPLVEKRLYETLVNRYPDMPHFKTDETNYKIPAAWLIDNAGWKQKSSSWPVRVHELQPLVLINPEAKSLDEVLAVATEIQKDIYQKFAIALEVEPQRLYEISLIED